MKPLLFLASLFLMFACGNPEKKTVEEQKVEPMDSSAGMVDSSAVVEPGDTLEMDTVITEDDEVKNQEPPSKEIKEAPKHGSPDDEEIRKMKEEKNKKKK